LVYAAVLAAWVRIRVASMPFGCREVAIARRHSACAGAARSTWPAVPTRCCAPAEQPALPQVKPRQIARLGRPGARSVPDQSRHARVVVARCSCSCPLVGLEVASLAGALPAGRPACPDCCCSPSWSSCGTGPPRCRPMLEVPFERSPRRGVAGGRKDGAEFWDPWPSSIRRSFPKGALADLAKGWAPRRSPAHYVTAAKAEPVPGTRRIDIAAGRPGWRPPKPTWMPTPTLARCRSSPATWSPRPRSPTRSRRTSNSNRRQRIREGRRAAASSARAKRRGASQ